MVEMSDCGRIGSWDDADDVHGSKRPSGFIGRSSDALTHPSKTDLIRGLHEVVNGLCQFWSSLCPMVADRQAYVPSDAFIGGGHLLEHHGAPGTPTNMGVTTWRA